MAHDNAAYQSVIKAQEQQHRTRFVSTPRRCGKSWAEYLIEHEKMLRESTGVQEYSAQRFIGIDPAKPGSDQTVVSVPVTGHAVYQGEWGTAEVFDIVAPKQLDTEHIWNMIVLAAELSRYG